MMLALEAPERGIPRDLRLPTAIASGAAAAITLERNAREKH